jgi:hypothetical protein
MSEEGLSVMSYCRWSSLNGYCDVYVYSDVDGVWRTHVASGRQPAGVPADGLDLLQAACADKNHPAMTLCVEQQKILSEWHVRMGGLTIDHPESGTSFTHSSPGECADNLERLAREGFIVPIYAIQELRKEQEKIDAC